MKILVISIVIIIVLGLIWMNDLYILNGLYIMKFDIHNFFQFYKNLF